MSQASSTAVTGDVFFSDPNAAKPNWILWAIGGVVLVVLIIILGKK